MKKRDSEVKRRTGQDVNIMPCSNDNIEYQENMSSVDSGDQHMMMGAGFANIAHDKQLVTREVIITVAYAVAVCIPCTHNKFGGLLGHDVHLAE